MYHQVNQLQMLNLQMKGSSWRMTKNSVFIAWGPKHFIQRGFLRIFHDDAVHCANLLKAWTSH